jgi:hypothetical protein
VEPEVVDGLQFLRVEHDLEPLRSHELFRHPAILLGPTDLLISII